MMVITRDRLTNGAVGVMSRSEVMNVSLHVSNGWSFLPDQTPEPFCRMVLACHLSGRVNAAEANAATKATTSNICCGSESPPTDRAHPAWDPEPRRRALRVLHLRAFLTTLDRPILRGIR
jgi:hypothetical protein